MMTDFLIAYWLHSTVLLASAWCLIKIARPRSSVVRERLWKLAAVLPVLTAVTSVGFRSAKAVPVAERQATIVGMPTTSVPRPLGSDQCRPLPNGRGAAQHHMDDRVELNVPIADEKFDVEQQAVEPVDPQIAAEADSMVELVDRFFEPVVRFENPGDELPSKPRFELDEAQQQSLVVEVPFADSSVTTAHEVAWLPILTFVSQALSAWVAIAVLWLLVRSMWFRSRLRKARRIDRGRAVELLRELNVAVTRGVTATLTGSSPRVRMLIVPSFTEPAAFGIWRPTIVLPPSCEALPRDELRAVLAHELGHIVRGDVWWLLIGRVLTTVLGFQPLNRIARREWTAAAECLCDSWAVDRGVERLTLARCLTALAEHRLTGVSLADALAAVGSPSSLRTRIERLVADPIVDPWSKRSRRWLLSSSAIAAAVLSAVMLPLPIALTASVPRPSGSGLHEDHAQHEPLADPPKADGTEMVREIETELTALRTELDRAERHAERQSDPQWLDAVEQLRDRERRLVERWRVLMNETGPAQENRTLFDADLR